MTRKQLYEIFEDIEQHRIYCKEQFADAILALPIEVPGDDEDVLEPIQNALYATHAFSLDDCTGLANGILSYLKEAGFAIVRGNDR